MKKRIIVVVGLLLALGVSVNAALVTNNLVVHLDAGAGVTTDENGGVSLWADQASLGGTQLAGNGNADLRPKLITNAVNGNSVIRFDGVDDWLVMNDNLTAGELDVDTISFFVVFKLDVTSGTQVVARARTSFNGTHYGAYFNDPDDQMIWHSRDSSGGFVGSGYKTYPPEDPWAGDYHMFTGLWYSNDILACRADGIQGVGKAGADSPAGEFTKMVIGGDLSLSFLLDGDIAELLIYNTGLGNADRDAVEAYLYDKYVPEPATLLLLGLGCGALRLRRKCK
jgi:hypothetical protein